MPPKDPGSKAVDGWLYTGLFLLSLATLLLEILCSRLLSVVSWYHVSFFAVSLAMLGMAAGGVSVFALGAKLANAPRALALASVAFAAATPLSHVISLALPMPQAGVVSLRDLLLTCQMIVVLTLPFYLSGVAIALALTRLGRSIGRLYAADLAGAAAGCLAVIPLLETTNITAAVFASALLASLAGLCFHRFAGLPAPGASAIAISLLAMTGVAATGVAGIGLVSGKGGWIPPEQLLLSAWNTHANVIALRPQQGDAFYWGAGEGARGFQATTVHMIIDAGASTLVTKWDGERSSLDWTRHDVTYLPYHLRRGDAAIIGVGGGRDVLSALAAGCRSVTGIEVNRILVDWLSGPLRDFARIAGRDDVSLVHDEARSYLARAQRDFDVIQMSLIDTWAATGAGAFALSENGLYTLEAWRLLLESLRPGGVLSVSRWFNPSRISETNRLVALGSAALLDRGVTLPARQLILVTRANVATLLVSNAPFGPGDLEVVREVSAQEGFRVVLAPEGEPAIPRLGEIANAGSLESLRATIADPIFDFSPPTDSRPYFFNMLRPGGLGRVELEPDAVGVAAGNIRAASTLLLLMLASSVLVGAIVLAPLALVEPPDMRRAQLLLSLLYFGSIGAGYMLFQFALLQRFSIYLGHPTYSLAVVLFTMIVFTGLGSLLSDRVDLSRRWPIGIPALIALGVAAFAALAPPALERTVALDLPARALLVVALTAPLSTLLGFCLPSGLRLVSAADPHAGPWMWGVNGAFSVLGSIAALALSLWWGIDLTLAVAAGSYALLTLPLISLRRAAYA